MLARETQTNWPVFFSIKITKYRSESRSQARADLIVHTSGAYLARFVDLKNEKVRASGSRRSEAHTRSKRRARVD